MISVEPGPNRDALGFEPAVLSSFDFLATDGFRCVHSDSTTVRYEKRISLGLNGVFVSVHHGHGSFELSVWIGRKRPAKYLVDVMEVVRWSGAYEAEGLGKNAPGFQVSSRENVEKLVARLAQLVSEYGGPFTRGDRKAFSDVLTRRRRGWQDYEKEVQLRKMREEAEMAWHRKDLSHVVKLYRPFASDLKPFEVKRLEYARKYENLTHP